MATEQRPAEETNEVGTCPKCGRALTWDSAWTYPEDHVADQHFEQQLVHIHCMTNHDLAALIDDLIYRISSEPDDLADVECWAEDLVTAIQLQRDRDES